jgi:hypothetical protein
MEYKMRKAVAVVLLFSLSCLVGTSNSYGADTKEFGAIIEESTALTNQLADILATVKDQTSADRVHPKVKRIVARIKDLGRKLNKLGQPTPEQAKELQKKYERSANEAEYKMIREAERLSETEFGPALVKELY